MGTWADALAPMVATLAGKNGRYDTNTPKLRAADMLALLGILSRSLPSAIERVCDGGCVRSDFAGPDGLYQAPSNLYALGSMQPLSSADYLFNAIPPGTTAWKRTPSKLTDAQIAAAQFVGIASNKITYEPVRYGSLIRNDQLELVSFVRQAIDDYQRASNQITNAIVTYFGLTASSDVCKAFMSAVRELASDLDVLGENPPTTLAQDVKGGLKEALTASENATVKIAAAGGAAAGWAANQVGKIAGGAVAGFFDSANLMTLAVVGVVGYVAIGKYL